MKSSYAVSTLLDPAISWSATVLVTDRYPSFPMSIVHSKGYSILVLLNVHVLAMLLVLPFSGFIVAR